VIKVTVFGRQECEACKAAIEKMTYFSGKWGKSDITSIDFVDMDTVDGLAEGAFRDVYDIPTVIIEEGSREIVRWVKKVPASSEFRDYFLKETLDDGIGDKGLC
jgi:thiol-disulfide isomerase/thioredoxin